MANPRFIKTFGICAALLASLSACTYLIPEDPSVPRYNQVIGERHRPQRNINIPEGPQSDNSAAVNSFNAPAPVPQVAQNDLPPMPPVDAATQARAEREMAMNSTPMPAVAERRAPVENPVDLAQNDISSVPPRPVMNGSGATSTRMQDVRRDLEHERATSRDMKSQLATDAANEPSALSTPVERVAPEPIGSMPVPPPAPTSSIVPPAPAPAPVAVNAAPPYIAPVPSVTYAPAPERIAVQDTPPPAPVAAPEPIRFTPPAPAVASVPEPIFVATPAMPVAPAPLAPGSFDPFATKPVAARASKATYAGSDFLPTSRYASKRD